MNLKIITIGIILTMVCSTLLATAVNDSIYPSKVWKHRLKELNVNFMLFLSDKELQKNNTYEKLKTFFNGCNTPKEFYDRVQTYVDEPLDVADYDLSFNEFRLPIIVDTIIDYNASLFCTHQSFLFAAGVKAMFSHYDEKLSRYVLNDGCGDFKLELWRSFDLHPPVMPWRSHYQIVVDKWNGSDTFEINNETANKIETDTWENEYRLFNKRDDCLFYPFFPAKLNSILYT